MLKRYGLRGLFYLGYCVIRTKLLFKDARLIRFPIDLRGKNKMQINQGFTTGKYCRIEVQEVEGAEEKNIRLIIGKNVQMNDLCHITASELVEIGDNVLIASKVYISDVSHGAYGRNNIHSSPLTIPAERPLITNPVKIEKNVWLGDGVCVLPGVTIGEGSIIGANAVVVKDIPPFSIAVGIPAKVVKQFNVDSQKWESSSS